MKKIRHKIVKFYDLQRRFSKNRVFLMSVNESFFDKAGNLVKEVNIDRINKIRKYYEYKYKYQDGNIIQSQVYEKKAGLVINTIYEYNKENRLVNINHFDREKQINQKWEYEYDQKGKKRREIWWYNPEEKMVTEYFYDRNGQLIKKISESAWLGKLICRYVYDKKGNRLVTYNGGTGIDGYKIKYEFNTDGLIVEQKRLYDSGKKEHKIYQYDENRNLKKTITYCEDSIWHDFFNNRGKITISKKYEDGALRYVWVWNYDKYSNVTSEYEVKYVCNCYGVKELPQRLETFTYEFY